MRKNRNVNEVSNSEQGWAEILIVPEDLETDNWMS
jgi:hypothetical protein